MNKENISLIIKCSYNNIQSISQNEYICNHYSTIYYDISNCDEHYLNKIVNSITTDFFIQIDYDEYITALHYDCLSKLLESKYPITKYTYNCKKDIILITLCYNEIKILPFALQYWKRICNKVIVYDNGSIDGSVVFLLKYGKGLVELRHFRYENNNLINDEELKEFKNNVWKEFRNQYKWCIMCDIDEMFYTQNINSFLSYINTNNIDVIKCNGYQLISTYFPQYDPKSLLHHLVKYGSKDNMYNKCLMFNMHNIKEINYDYGAHKCYPVSNNNSLNIYQFNNVYLYHAKWLTYQYVEDKYKILQNKLSNFNVQNNFGTEYQQSENSIKNQYINLLNNAVFIDDWYREQEIIDIDLINKKLIKPVLNNKCCIIIPIYKKILSKQEYISLSQLIKIMGNKYDIICIYPKSLDISYYKDFDFLSWVQFEDVFFNSIETYNQLCLNWKFYNKFSYYKYMLIYQLDAYINYDNLEYFINLNYDFIGSLHYSPYLMCGNGGFSLRKIQSMINILKNCDIDYTIYEDIFINSKILNKCPDNICRFFSICADKENQLNILGHEPMGYHYF